jgi:hypothetical protein
VNKIPQLRKKKSSHLNLILQQDNLNSTMPKKRNKAQEIGQPTLSNQVRYPQTGGGGTLSACCQHYLEELADPFNVSGACVPSGICMPTEKMRVTAKGTFVAPDGYAGCVSMNPFAGVASASLGTANYDSFLMTTDATYAASTIPTVSTVTGVNAEWSDSNYGASYFTTGTIMYRLVAAGLQINYIGVQDAMGGTCTMLHAPNDLTVGSADQASLNKFKESMDFTVSRKVHTLTWSPSNPTDFDWVDPGAPVSLYDSRSMVAMCVAPAGYDHTWRFSAVAHYELIGKAISFPTMTLPDPVGAAAVQHAVSTAPSSYKQLPTHDRVKLLKHAARATVDQMSGPFIEALRDGPPAKQSSWSHQGSGFSPSDIWAFLGDDKKVQRYISSGTSIAKAILSII